MGKTIKIGRMVLDVKSLAFGMALAFAGLSIAPTQSIFEKILNTFKNFLGGIFKKK